MGRNDHIDEELSARLDWLLGNGIFAAGSAAEGIAKQISNQGEKSLSEKQKTVFNSIIIPALETYAEDITDAI